MLGGLLTLLITFFITIWFKISIHMVGLGGLMALIIFISFYLKVNLSFFFFIWILLIISWYRRNRINIRGIKKVQTKTIEVIQVLMLKGRYDRYVPE
jgi:hypothetical protein